MHKETEMTELQASQDIDEDCDAGNCFYCCGPETD